MENTSGYYYNQLATTEKPGNVLAKFYCTLFDREETNAEKQMCNKLVRTFGRFIVFYSILDMSGNNGGKEPDEVYPYLYTICQRRFESANVDSTIQSRESLARYITEMEKEKEKILNQKIKIPSSKGL